MKLSECFYSIQGEGSTCGVPSFFVRVADCNLLCGGPNGCLIGKTIEGKPCSWWCDSWVVWKHGVETTNEQLLEKIQALSTKEGVDLVQGLIDGTIHFVWTGGEPTMEQNRGDVRVFVEFLNEKFPENKCFHELETNGTIFCDDGFYDLMDQINCSPKLANAGMKKVARVVPDAINQIKTHSNHWWKFVINFEEDIKEIEETYIKPFGLDKRQVILMPGVDNINDLPERTRFLFEMCKKYGFRGVTRGHILAWNKTVGV
jgi:organic radical activating enzyme